MGSSTAFCWAPRASGLSRGSNRLARAGYSLDSRVDKLSLARTGGADSCEERVVRLDISQLGDAVIVQKPSAIDLLFFPVPETH